MLLFAIVLALGTLTLHVARSRVKVTIEAQQRLLEIADNLWRDAIDANMAGEPEVVSVHNLIVRTAALAPHISAGVVQRKIERGMAPDPAYVEFLSRNGWMLEHMFCAFANIRRLEFHAKPWMPSNWFDALAAYKFSDPKCWKAGYSYTPRATAVRVRAFSELSTTEGDRLLHPA